jgi:hypothetical protein
MEAFQIEVKITTPDDKKIATKVISSRNDIDSNSLKAIEAVLKLLDEKYPIVQQ